MFAQKISYSCYTLNVSIIKRIEFCNIPALRNNDPFEFNLKENVVI